MIVSSSYYILWTVLLIFRVDWCEDLISYCGDWTYEDSVCADAEMPKTRMLPGSGPCDLRLLIPDAGLGKEGFHDVVIENLLGTSVWRSKHVTPADVIGLCQRWPKAVFQVMRERSVELEDLRRKAYMSGQPAYRYTGRGYCPVCKTKSDHGLDTHMMCHHLDLGQLWRCPVEWCAVWKGSVRECRDHFNEKHSGSETIDFDKVSKAFPAWTVTRDFWKQAIQPKISGIAVDVLLFRCIGKRTGEVPMDCFPGTKDVATSHVTKTGFVRDSGPDAKCPD